MFSKMLSSALLAALTFQAVTVTVNANPTVATGLTTEEEIKNWISTTTADLTFIGEPLVDNPLDKRAGNVMVVYCNNRINNACGGACTIYNGPNTCLSAPGTQCIMATANVGFCDRSNCGGSCNSFNSCGTRLDSNFCATPGTASILVPFI